MEQAGRILRAQATRQQVFHAILPLRTFDLIKPAEGSRRVHKDSQLMKEKVSALREALDDPDSLLAMTNVIEQACNHFLQTEAWPKTYEEVQPVPVLSISQLTFAGDDGMEKGQTYRARITFSHVCDLVSRAEHTTARLFLHLRAPSESGTWAWGQVCGMIELPEPVVKRLAQGASPQAPTLREMRGDDGNRLAVLDLILEVPAEYVSDLDQQTRALGWDWGVRSLITVSIVEKPNDGAESRQISRPVFLDTGGLDGRQARLRREIDQLKACKERYVKLVKEAASAQVERNIALPPHFHQWQKHSEAYEARITLCWKKYERRNRELAHLAANLLIMLALLSDCRLLLSQGLTARPPSGKCVNYSGWSSSIALRTSQPKNILALLSTSHLRKRLLLRA